MSVYKDQAGTPYSSSDGKPAASGSTVQIYNGTGQTQQGTMVGGYVVPNKK